VLGTIIDVIEDSDICQSEEDEENSVSAYESSIRRTNISFQKFDLLNGDN
jgi:hypothetical protein